MVSPSADFGHDFRLTLITNDPQLALEADHAGVNRVGVDLEHLGKTERQAGHDARISPHGWNDLSTIGRVVHRADLFVRINPIHAGTESEVETALRLGATVLMLPSFERADEVVRFVSAVRARALVVILVERAPAVARIRDILAVRGIDEVMVGLNDLHLQFRVANHFEVLASPLVDMLAAEVLAKRLPLAIGGVGRVNDTSLPVPADLVLAQYPRLRATGAWIARCFFKGPPPTARIADPIRELRTRLTEWSAASPDALERARDDLARAAAAWHRASCV
jgi:hypothetical protein